MSNLNENGSRMITVEAFRFVELKKPEIFTGVSASFDFITHPAPEESLVLTGIGDPNFTFEGYSSLSVLRNLNTGLYGFTFWLKDNKAQLSVENLATATASVEQLTPEQRIEIWDNLFYQTQNNNSQTLVEGLIRMLQADNFLTHYLDVVDIAGETGPFDLGRLRKVAKASVIIPNELFVQDPNEPSITLPSIDEKSKKILSNKLEMDILRNKIALMTAAIKEIDEAEKYYIVKQRQAYELAYQTYQEEVAELMEATEDVIREVGYVKVCGKEIEPFSFTPEDTWDETYLETVISEEALNFYNAYKTEKHLYIADTRNAMEEAVTKWEHQWFQKAKKNKKKTLIHKSIRIPLRNRPLNNSYMFKIVELDHKKGYFSVYVTQCFENEATRVRKITVTAKLPEAVTMNDTVEVPTTEPNNFITLQLFSEGIPLPDVTVKFDLVGQFETEDDDYNNSFEHKGLTLSSQKAVSAPRFDPKGNVIPLPGIFGFMDVKIAAFKKVNQTLCCYTEGEVSHIENILAKEYKERATRNLIRTEITIEEQSERELEQLSDTTSTDRHEIQSEVSLLLQEDKSKNFAASASAGGSYTFGDNSLNFNTSGSFGTSSSSSSSSSFNEAASYAKELTARAMKRLVEKTSYKRTARMIREFEETNKHGFDNREGDKHVTGVYRWVDKIYKNELVNYGKRLMYDITLPEPARNYKYLLTKKLEDNPTASCDSVVLEAPLKPDNDFNIQNSGNINQNNFADLAAYYGVDIEDYPVSYRRIAKSFSENFYQSGAKDSNSDPWHGAKDFEFEIPEGYRCTDFKCIFAAQRHGKDENIESVLIIGNRSYAFNEEGAKEFNGNITIPFFNIQAVFDPVEGYLPISLVTTDVGGFGMTVWADCYLKQEVIDDWKARFFSAVWQSYYEMEQQYQDALHEQCLNQQQDALANGNSTTPNYSINPLMARAIEKREIKRLIIELMLMRVNNAYLPIGYNGYVDDPCNNTLNINTDNFYKARARYIKFLENAFEWEIMAYTFHPYYWADENEWADLLSLDAAVDPVFLAFLQSGMADVVLPVKPGLEKSVAFLLETGILWNGTGFILDGQDDLYPAIEENLQIEVDGDGNEIRYDDAGNPIPVVEATWETRVPTTLNIVQDYNNPLAAEGLPCFCNGEGEYVIGFVADGQYNILQGKTGVE